MAIVGILSAVAIPAYQDYVARSQVSEGIVLASGAEPIIAEYHSNHGSYPTSTDIGFNGYVGKYIDNTEIADSGKIVATFNSNANSHLKGQTVTLTPEESESGNLKWDCESSVESKYLPTSCHHVDASSGGESGNGNESGNGEPASPPKTPEELAFNTTGAFAYNGHPATYADGVVTISGRNYPVTSYDADGTMHFTLVSSVQGTIDPAGRFTTINPTNPDVATTSYNNTTGVNFQLTATKLTAPVINTSIITKVPTIQSNATSFSEISASLSVLNSAAGTAKTSPNESNFSSYNTALTNFKNSVAQVKANNGGKYPDDWSAAFIEDILK